jgi:hypothetical protein
MDKRWMDECHVVEAYLINVHFHHHQSSSLGRESMEMDGWMKVMWWRPTLSMVIFTIIILHLWGGKVWMDECQVVGGLYLVNGHFT